MDDSRGRGRGWGLRGSQDQMQSDVVQPEYYEAHLAKALEMMERTIVLKTSNCRLPDVQQFFSGESWELPDLVKSRDQLNKAKNSLDSWERRYVPMTISYSHSNPSHRCNHPPECAAHRFVDS